MRIEHIRPYAPADAEACRTMLAAEGLRDEEMEFERAPTVVLENGRILGMCTLGRQHGYPYLQHFCLARDARSNPRALRLIRTVRSLLRQAGDRRMIIHVQNPRYARLAAWYFRARPYALSPEGHPFFLVEV